MISKLPKTYYKYDAMELLETDREVKDRINISLSVYLSQKIEKFAYSKNIPSQSLLKQLILNAKLLDDDDLEIEDTYKKHFNLLESDENKLKHIKANKQFNIYMSRYAKIKLHKNLLKSGFDLVFMLKKELVKAGIIEISDLSF